MFCTNCGNPLSTGATICSACKTPIGERASRDTVAAQTAQAGSGRLIGRTLGGRYQLNSLIGSGGMGEIYRAYRTHIGDTVAVKVLRSDVIGNDKSRQRFFREARAAALLHHPNAVVIHDFGEEEGGIAYIVMELLIGRSLRQVLQAEKTLDVVRSYGILRQAAAALEAGHRSGIVHRDIKPDNIILLDTTDDTDHVKILDFGIAKLREGVLEGGDSPPPHASDSNNLTNAGMVIGTPNYMSPEQCQGEEADARSDIYSLGVVMYEVLTGIMPFNGKTPTSVAIKHVTETPRPLRATRPEIPIEVESVIMRALAKAPVQRPQSTLEMAREYAQALRNAGLTSPLPTVPGNTPPVPDILTGAIASERQTSLMAEAEPVQDIFQTSISDTPVSGAMAAVVVPEENADIFRTSIGDESLSDSLPTVSAPVTTPAKEWNVPTVRPKTHDYTDALPAPNDQYATLIPEAPGAAARPNPFAEISSALTETISSPVIPSPSGEEARPEESRIDKARTAHLVAQTQQGSGVLVELPNAPETAKLKRKSVSQWLLLAGVSAVVLTGGVWLWSVLTQDNSDKRLQPTPTPVAQVSPTLAPNVNVPPPEGMVYIPGGEIVIGREDGDEYERPVHKVAVAPFYLDITEVTVGQYADFLAANLDHLPPPSWNERVPQPGTETLPVTDVSWRDAYDYAVWKQRRLPTEEEWEFAARGSSGALYPWGGTWQPGHANAADDEKDKRRLEPVGMFALGKSPFGVFDMAGNAWEWTDSDYKGYEGTEIKVPEGFLNLKTIRGGSYTCTPGKITATYRRGWPATVSDWPEGSEPKYSETGFRTAQDVPKK